jgi:hypothetical protein
MLMRKQTRISVVIFCSFGLFPRDSALAYVYHVLRTSVTSVKQHMPVKAVHVCPVMQSIVSGTWALRFCCLIRSASKDFDNTVYNIMNYVKKNLS